MVTLLSLQKSSASSESSASKSGQASAEDLEQLLVKSPFVKRIFELGFTFCFYREALKNVSPDISSNIHYQLGVASDSTSMDGEVGGGGGGIVYDKLLLPIFTPNPLIRESFGSMLLDQCSLILLNSYFPSDVRGQMFPLFSSHYQGESFSTFCKQLLSFRGPTVIVLKDKGGHIFGGFASEAWTCSPQFTGTSLSLSLPLSLSQPLFERQRRCTCRFVPYISISCSLTPHTLSLSPRYLQLLPVQPASSDGCVHSLRAQWSLHVSAATRPHNVQWAGEYLIVILHI